MKEDSQSLSHRLRRLINMGHDKAPEEEIIAGIEEGVSFQGAKLWILVLAIFVASLGLNTNSTAVIIGAMLISPLMGPIIGMGLGVGVYDFSLLKRAFRNYLVATAFSVVTATVYFLITPIDEAQSELLARTSPTIYDVAIAICGGLAGIIALSSRSQRTGNVIPGVAIATALMPPLCTVGFGIATGNWFYAAGALYLYLINTIFIALSTFVGVAFIMRFRKQTMINKRREKQVHRYITTIALLTIVPSLFITFHIVQQTIYEERVQQFIHEALVFDNTQVIDHSIDLSEHSIRVMLFGEEVDSAQIEEARKLLPAYRLDGSTLQVVQASANTKNVELQTLITKQSREKERSAELLSIAENKTHKVEQKLAAYQEPEVLARTILPELQLLFPQVAALSMSKGATVSLTDSALSEAKEHIAVVRTVKPMQRANVRLMRDWLRQRTAYPELRIVVTNASGERNN